MSLEDIPGEHPSDGSSATRFLPRLKTLEGVSSRAGWSLSPELRRQITSWSRARIDVAPAALGDWSVLYGAHALAQTIPLESRQPSSCLQGNIA